MLLSCLWQTLNFFNSSSGVGRTAPAWCKSPRFSLLASRFWGLTDPVRHHFQVCIAACMEPLILGLTLLLCCDRNSPRMLLPPCRNFVICHRHHRVESAIPSPWRRNRTTPISRSPEINVALVGCVPRRGAQPTGLIDAPVLIPTDEPFLPHGINVAECSPRISL